MSAPGLNPFLRRRSTRWIAAAALGAAWGVMGGFHSSHAADAPELPPVPQADGAATANLRPPAPPPPAPPPSEGPVRKFRELLALDPTARETALKNRTPAQQEFLREQLRLFDALPAAEQEARLGLMQLRFYMLSLIRTAPTNRTERLQSIPVGDRELIAARLEAWDRLPADQQKELLQNEAVLSSVARFESSSTEKQAAMLQMLSPARRQEFEASIERWRALPEARRIRMTGNFNQFFELSEREKQRALERVDAAERVRIQEAIAALQKLPPSERARCLEALNRYAEMKPEEKTRFLRNAARWQSMTPEERQTWRAVAARVAPGTMAPLQPPMPPPPLPPNPRATPASGVSNAQSTR